MKRCALSIALALLCYSSYAQRLSVHAAGGIISNSGPVTQDLRKARANFTHVIGELGLMADMGKWQAGAGLSVFNMMSGTSFIFEQYVLPDGSFHSYEIAMGDPVYNPYLYAGRIIPIEQHVYFSAGLRLGMIASPAQERSKWPYEYGFNTDGKMIFRTATAFSYGLQCGFNVQASRSMTAGINVFWQQVHTSSHVSYNTYYTALNNMGEKKSYPIIVNKDLNYRVSMQALELFLRFTLFNKAPHTKDDDIAKPIN